MGGPLVPRSTPAPPAVVRAMTSPSGLALAGAGAGLGILAGLGLPGALVLAVVGWAGRVGFAALRGRRGERIDPFAVGEPWRHFVRSAIQAQSRFDHAVAPVRDGPLRERLTEIGRRLSTGVEESWRVARHGQALAEARRHIDVPRAQRELERADDQSGGAAGALQAQLDSAARLDRVAKDAENRLRLLTVRLDEVVARAIELAVQAEDSARLTGLRTDADALVDELEALRAALDDVDDQPPGAE